MAEQPASPGSTAGPASRPRQQEDRAFVLHSYPYRETSLVVELFTRAHGRVAVVAKGARRPRSQLRGLLLAFQPLAVAWSGRSELRTLVRAEWECALPQLGGLALLCGLYVNELMLKLTRREDPHEGLFDTYASALATLRDTDRAGLGPLLRRFELALLAELGYGAPLDRDAASGEEVRPDGIYEYQPERGPVSAAPDADRLQFRGKTLLDLTHGDFSDPATRQEARQLMRFLINLHLDGQPLHTRQLLGDVQTE